MSRFRIAAVAAIIAAVSLLLAGCFGRQSSEAGGVSTAKKILERPSGDMKNVPSKAKMLYDLAWISGQTGKVEKAAELFKQSIKLAPNFSEAHHGLGLAYARMNQIGAAVSEFQKAIELNPNFTDAYTNLGIAYEKMGESDLAFEKWRKALQLNPQHGPTHLALGKYQYIKGDYSLAIRHFLEAARLLPKNPEPHKMLALIYIKKKLYRSAAPPLREALKRDPNDDWCLYTLAKILHNQNHIEEAARLYKRVLDLEIPRFRQKALMNLGTIAFQKGRLEKAQTYFEQAYAMDPSNSWLMTQIEKIRRLLQNRTK